MMLYFKSIYEQCGMQTNNSFSNLNLRRIAGKKQWKRMIEEKKHTNLYFNKLGRTGPCFSFALALYELK